jgi:hypothetical protein
LIFIQCSSARRFAWKKGTLSSPQTSAPGQAWPAQEAVFPLLVMACSFRDRDRSPFCRIRRERSLIQVSSPRRAAPPSRGAPCDGGHGRSVTPVTGDR